jgi:hypothetical protein
MTSILIGVVFIVAGAWGCVHWSHDLLVVLRGLGSISLLVGGVVALIAGVGSLQPRRKDDDAKS